MPNEHDIHAPCMSALARGVLGAATGAIAGSIGAAATHSNAKIAARMGGVGGFILNVFLWGFLEEIFVCGSLSSLRRNSLFKAPSSLVDSLLRYISTTVLSGLLGYAILYKVIDGSERSFKDATTSFAIGGMITALPNVLILLYFIAPLIDGVMANIDFNGTSSLSVASEPDTEAGRYLGVDDEATVTAPLETQTDGEAYTYEYESAV